MITGIKRKVHGFADYSYIPLVLAAPKLAHFKDDKEASEICYVAALTVLGYSLFTDAEWGMVKLIPYKTHAVLDIALGAATLGAACFHKGKNKRARNTLLLMGLTGLVVGALSVIGAKHS